MVDSNIFFQIKFKNFGLTLIDAHCKWDYNGIKKMELFYFYCGDFFEKPPFSEFQATYGLLNPFFGFQATVRSLKTDWR